MKQVSENEKRLRELLKEKRRLLDRMRKHRKALAEDRDKKKQVNEEITKLRKSGFAFHGMTKTEAKAKVSQEIKSVDPKDIFPPDLEKQFDKLERTTDVKYRKDSVDISDIDDDGDAPIIYRSSRADDDDANTIMVDPNETVIDFSGDLDDDGFSGPENIDEE